MHVVIGLDPESSDFMIGRWTPAFAEMTNLNRG